MAATAPAVQPVAVASVLAVFDEDNGLFLPSQNYSVEGTDRRRTMIQLRYLSEGGANVIYAVEAADRIPNGAAVPHLPKRLQRKVFRLRKDQATVEEDSELEPYVSTAEIESYFNKEIAAKLPHQHLLAHDMIKIQQEVIKACNASLAKADEVRSRPKRRMADRLRESEPHGLLLDDMRPEPDSSFSIEFKPKWLSDAPNPDNVDRKRCRTCALRAMRNSTSLPQPGKDRHFLEFCPLSLMHLNGTFEQGFRCILSAAGIEEHPLWPSHGERVVDRMKKDFQSGQISAIITELATLQRDLDPYGCLSFDSQTQRSQLDSENLELAMTLRDCSIFMRFDWAGERPIEVKLADLDRKDWTTRLERWRSTEKRLLDGGWYTGEEVAGDTGSGDEVCILWR